MKTTIVPSIPASLGRPRHLHALVFTVVGLGLALALGLAQGAVAQQTQGAVAQQNPVTAIDIALEPDATMLQHAKDANARLLKSFPKGFTLDETHHPHVTMLQQFVRTDDIDKVFAAANAVLAKEKPRAWTLKAFKYYYIPSPPIGDIQKSLIEYVANFVTIAAGKHFNPHVTIGVGTETYLNEMLAEPFESFTFSATGASVYQLGTFGTARKELKALPLTP